MKNKLIFLGVALVLLAVIFSSLNSFEKKYIPVNFEVGGAPGFDLNSSALTFGRLPVGASSTRQVSVANDFKQRVYVSISSSRDISKFIHVSKNDFFLESGEKQVLDFTIITNNETKVGKYDGYVTLKISRWHL